jgi:hypothetical protein
MKFISTIILLTFYSASYSQPYVGETKLVYRISPDSIWIAMGSKPPESSVNLNQNNIMVNIFDSCKILHNKKFFMASVGAYNYLFSNETHQSLFNIQRIERAALKSKNLKEILNIFYKKIKTHLTYTTGTHTISEISSFIQTKKHIMETYVGTFIEGKPLVVKMNFQVFGGFADWHVDTTTEYINQMKVGVSGNFDMIVKSQKISNIENPSSVPTFLKLEQFIKSELETTSSLKETVNVLVLFKDGFRWQLGKQKCIN